MKRIPIAAAALLFGASAYAMVPSTDPTGVWVDKDSQTVTDMTAIDAGDPYKLQPATVDWWDTAKPVAATTVAETDDGLMADELADASDVIDPVDKSDAAFDDEIEAAAEDEPALESAVAEIEPAAYETTAVDEEPLPIDGSGGPYEGVDTAAAALTPRPAAQNYPACSPGPGDDNCIQLYEPGVREQLASWDQPTGGFAGAGETRVAMGGPYEPTDSATETERLNQQALADSTSALQRAQMADAAVVQEAAIVDDTGYDTAAVDDALIHEAAMSGNDDIDDALGETLEDEEPIEV